MVRSTDRISELQRELEANPSSRQFYQLGELLRRDGRSEEAAPVFRAGLEHYPRYVAAWVSLGRAELDREEPVAAAGALEQALELDGENPVAWRLLGEARLAAEQREEALVAFRRAAEMVPGDEGLQQTVARLEEAATPRRAAGVGEAAGVAPPYLAPAVERREAPAGSAAALEDPFAFTAPSVAGGEEQDVFQLPAEEPADESLVFGAVAELPLGESGPFTPIEPAWVTQAVAVVPAEAPPREVVSAAPPSLEVEPPHDLEGVEEAGATGGAETPAPFVEERAEPAAPLSPPESEPDMDTQPDVVLPVMEPPPAVAQEASVEAARGLIRREDLAGAEAMLQRAVAAEPDNREAQDLLELVRDMLEPMPEVASPVSPRERKIAALQRWLACLTLTRERATP